MKAAMAVWGGRIAPLFDVVGRIRFLEIASGRVTVERDEPVAGLNSSEKALRLAEAGVELLICGAISRPIQAMVEAYGIRVVPFVTGEPGRVAQALAEGRLESALFAMPGCRRRACGVRNKFERRGRVGGPGRSGKNRRSDHAR